MKDRGGQLDFLRALHIAPLPLNSCVKGRCDL
nr:MAG TPA: hypothetical protein [Caudoviricetes sp.]